MDKIAVLRGTRHDPLEQFASGHALLLNVLLDCSCMPVCQAVQIVGGINFFQNVRNTASSLWQRFLDPCQTFIIGFAKDICQQAQFFDATLHRFGQTAGKRLI